MDKDSIKSVYKDIEPYITKDGSIIRELIHPSIHGNKRQSLAEATLPSGCTTKLHYHISSEEIYFVTAGHGLMRLEDREFDICKGDTLCIAAGSRHNLTNIGTQDLVILCSCCPPYSHDDTVLVAD